MIPYLLNLIDIITTLYALNRGAVEANPIMAAVIGVHPLLFVFVKAVLAFPLCLWISRRASTETYIAACIFLVAVVVNNILTIGVILHG